MGTTKKTTKKTQEVEEVKEVEMVDKIKALAESNIPSEQELHYGEGENAFTIHIYPVLTFERRMLLVNRIADGVFPGDEKSINDYAPQYLGLVQKFNTLLYFTDIQLPTSLNDLQTILNYTPIYQDVAAILGSELVSIFDDANALIEVRKQYLIRKTDTNALTAKLSNTVKDFMGKISKEDVEKAFEAIKSAGANGAIPQSLIDGLTGQNKV